jgi:hypothetical protein
LSKVVGIITRTDSTATRAGMHVVFTLFIFHTVIVVDVVGEDDLDFASEDEAETVTANGFFNTGKARTITPIVELTSESISFEFEQTKFTSGDNTVTTRSVNVSDRRVDNGRFGRATNLRQVG